MERYDTIYARLVVIALVFLAMALLLPANQGFFKGVVALPGVFAAFGIMVQLFRDQLARERPHEIPDAKEPRFDLGIASHMASIAYDKYVSFCEEYVNEVHACLETLIKKGATKEALKLAANLAQTRMRHSAWITGEIEEKLFSFELAFRKVGAGEALIESLPVGSEQWNNEIEETFRLFNELIGARDPSGSNGEKEAAATYKMVDYIRAILGIDELTELRQKIIQKAKESI